MFARHNIVQQSVSHAKNTTKSDDELMKELSDAKEKEEAELLEIPYGRDPRNYETGTVSHYFASFSFYPLEITENTYEPYFNQQ